MSNQMEGHLDLQNFRMDVLTGLSCLPKNIHSKYLYNNKGAQIYNSITCHPDYYLTRIETDILKNNQQKIINILKKAPLNLIEFGPGDGIKTQIIADEFCKQGANFKYTPIDISASFLQTVSKRFKSRYPHIKIQPLQAEFLNGMRDLTNSEKKCIIFLGSSIGNFSPFETYIFLQEIKQCLQPGDYLLIGFDLLKDINLLMRAYKDSDGLTAKFNLNLLHRINDELDANFCLDNFSHYSTFNVHTGAMESYLLSLRPQQVSIGMVDFNFGEYEPIHVECSYKYLLSQINDLAFRLKFDVVENYIDANHFFVDALWVVK